jgi:hypothetical protein
MFKIRYVLPLLGVALFACNHENDRPTTPETGTSADIPGPDSEARAAGDVQTEEASKNYAESGGGSLSRSGEVPAMGGTGMGGTGGGVGRSDNNGSPNGKTP